MNEQEAFVTLHNAVAGYVPNIKEELEDFSLQRAAVLLQLYMALSCAESATHVGCTVRTIRAALALILMSKRSPNIIDAMFTGSKDAIGTFMPYVDLGEL